MVNALGSLLRLLMALNNVLLRIGQSIAWVALAIMVFVILLQVFFRYVLNNALPWPDEAARFLMLWMTGLIAPLGYRHGGFVAIEMLPQAMPERAARFFALVLLLISLSVLVIGLSYGWDHATGFGGNFDSSSLKLPLDLIGFESIRVKLRYIYASLMVCMALLILVNMELLLRNLLGLIAPLHPLPRPADTGFSMSGAD